MPPRQPPRSSDTRGPDTRTPFLKVTDVAKDGDTLLLTGFTRDRVAGQFGDQIIMEVTVERTMRTYDFAIKSGGEQHRKLHKRLGRDPLRWRGSIVVKPVTERGYTFLQVQDVDSDDPPFDPEDIGPAADSKDRE